MFRRKTENRVSGIDIAAGIRRLISRDSSETRAFYDSLEDLLIESDFGAAAAVQLVEELRERRSGVKENWGSERCIEELKAILRPSLVQARVEPPSEGLGVYLVLGVNGVGKTTTIAKMAHRFITEGKGPVTLAAADTFRAAAVEQLALHARRTGARLVKQDAGSDPGAVVHDALSSALSRGDRVVIADTAGRMHNRGDLVNQLAKIDRIAAGKIGENGVYRKILVIDATTGQNGLRQAEIFHEAVGVDAVVISKFDSSARGGQAAAIGRGLGLPFAYLGRGEGMDDLDPFSPDEYLDHLLAEAR